MMRFVLAGGSFLAVLILTELVSRRTHLQKELSRKIVHITTGCMAAALPLVLSYHYIMALCLTFVIVMTTSKWRQLFRAVHEVQRQTYGELVFPVGIGLAAWLFPVGYQYASGVLIMALSDGLASIVGQRYGHKKFHLLRATKSYVGSAVFWAVSYIIVATSLALYHPRAAVGLIMLLSASASTALTIVEAATNLGLDNLILPPLGSLCLYWAMQLV